MNVRFLPQTKGFVFLLVAVTTLLLAVYSVNATEWKASLMNAAHSFDANTNQLHNEQQQRFLSATNSPSEQHLVDNRANVLLKGAVLREAPQPLSTAQIQQREMRMKTLYSAESLQRKSYIIKLNKRLTATPSNSRYSLTYIPHDAYLTSPITKSELEELLRELNSESTATEPSVVSSLMNFVMSAVRSAPATETAAVDYVAEYLPEYKVAPTIMSDIEELKKLEGSKLITLSALLLPTNEHKRVQNVMLASSEIKQQQFALSRAVAADIKSAISNQQRMRSAMAANEIKVAAVSPMKVAVVVPADADIAGVLEAMANHQQVHWIEAVEPLKAENVFAKRIMQSTNGKVTNDVELISEKLGLSGNGTVVGVGDSGMDYNNCYMFDSNHPVPFYDSSSQPVTVSNHRKVAGYSTFMDNVDDLGGHGTHVVGTILGKSARAGDALLNNFNGMAPNSKIAFMDIGCSTPGGCKCDKFDSCPCISYTDEICPQSDGALYMPMDLNFGYFPFAHALGARIHSNSIGGSIGRGYGASSVEIDQFMRNNPDFLIVWSAGNSGRNDGYMTLTGPLKQAKNSLIIAASQSTRESWGQVFDVYRDFETRAKSVHSSLLRVNFCSCNTTCNRDICDRLNAATDPAAILSLICELTVDCSAADAAQYAAGDSSIASSMLLSCPTCAKKTLSSYSHENIADFSSLGPAMDGRISPQVASPGNALISAKSHANVPDQCPMDESVPVAATFALSEKSGTSMATPAAAGTAALIQEYFKAGFYPSGARNAGDAMNPSASLVKAMIINGATPMSGTARGSMKFKSFNEAHQRYIAGFGLINLNNVLNTNNADTTRRLFVNDMHTLYATRQQHKYYIPLATDKADTQDVVVTVAWTDEPGSPAALVALVNDLDLSVRVKYSNLNAAKTFIGNVPVDKSVKIVDHLNTVEKVVIPAADLKDAESIEVYVTAFNIPQAQTPQHYSLVLTGALADQSSFQFVNQTAGIDDAPDGFIIVSSPVLALGIVATIGITAAITGIITFLVSKRFARYTEI